MNRSLVLALTLFQLSKLWAIERASEDFAALCEEVSDPADRLKFMHRSHDLVFRQTMGNGVGRGGPRLGRPERPTENHEIGKDFSDDWYSEHYLNHLIAADLVGLLAQPLPRVYLIQSAEVSTRAATQKGLAGLMQAAGLLSLPSTIARRPSKPAQIIPYQGSDSFFALGNRTPSRPLDHFESFALSRIRQGSDLIKMERERQIRAFGAIRASQACLRCHDGKPGDLLGAFTYFIARTPDESHSEDFRNMRRALTMQGSRGLTPFIRPMGIPDASFFESFNWIAYQGFVTQEMTDWLEKDVLERTQWTLGE